MRITRHPIVLVLAAALVCELVIIAIGIARPASMPVAAASAPANIRQQQLAREYSQLHPGADPVDHRFAYSNLTISQQQLIGYDIASAAPLAQLLVARAAPAVEISLRTSTDCGLQNCTTGGLSRPVSVQLLASSFTPSAGERFVIWHELGHAIDRQLMSDERRAPVLAVLRASPAWQACFAPSRQYTGSSMNGADARGCLSDREIFADQLAIYATGSGRSLSSYGLPMLYDPALLGSGSAGDFERALSVATG